MKKLVVTLTFLIVHLFIQSPSSAEWEVVGQMPQPVAGGRAVVLDSTIFIMGGTYGIAGGAVQIENIQRYSPWSNQWSNINPASGDTMISERSGFVAGVKGGEIYYCGGVLPNISNPFSIFSLERWSPGGQPAVFNYNPEFNRVYGTGLVYNDKMYLIGGYRVGGDTLPPISYLAVYDLNTSAITFREDSLFGNFEIPYQQMSARLGDDIYIFGGVQFGIFRSTLVFNTVNHLFRPAAPLTSVRAGGAAVAIGEDLILITGGYTESQIALDSTFYYHVDSAGNFNVLGPPMNFPRQDHTAVYYDGAVYVFGGWGINGSPVTYVERLDILTSVEDDGPVLAAAFSLNPNFPNPFNATTRISYELGRSAPVKIEIFSVTGKKVKTLLNQKQSSGLHTLTWDSRDDRGRSVGSGIYLLRMVTPDFTDTKKMILVK